MTDRSKLVQVALEAVKETKKIEFKKALDPAKPGVLCELIKDIVAISNSGGGVIVFGLDAQVIPSGFSTAKK